MDHVRNQPEACGGHKMLERVSAHDVPTGGVDRSIRELQDLRDAVGAKPGRQVPDVAESPGVQRKQQDDREKRSVLRERVGTKVTDAMELRPAPVSDAARRGPDNRSRAPYTRATWAADPKPAGY